MALESSKSPTHKTVRPAIALCVAVMLVALTTVGFDSAANNGHAPSASKANATMVSGLVTAADTHHGDEDAGHHHESVQCSHCPSCSGALPYAPALDCEDVVMVRALAIPWNYDDVVPDGIRRPPRRT